MTDVFKAEYSDAYDSLYGDKDYAAECDLIEWIFREYSNGQIARILDLGCGTGGHALELARRGYEVVGVDRSESMLSHARSKPIGDTNGSVVFEQGDIRNFELQREFDAAIMMFAVLGYQIENADLLAALRTTRRHLRPGAVFAFDCWYGPAVMTQGLSQRVKVVASGDERLLRMAGGSVDTRCGTCTIDYRLWRLRGSQLISETQETHLIRYLFKSELDLLLAICGFSPLRLGAFPEFERDPDETSWNVLCVAKAVEVEGLG